MEDKTTINRTIYQEGITQGVLKDIPPRLALRMYYQAMKATINYIVKFEPKATGAQQPEISEKVFNKYLYGVRI